MISIVVAAIAVLEKSPSVESDLMITVDGGNGGQ
jgi:hypothetical protein